MRCFIAFKAIADAMADSQTDLGPKQGAAYANLSLIQPKESLTRKQREKS